MKNKIFCLAVAFVALMIFSVETLAQDNDKNEAAVSVIFVRQNPDFKDPSFKFDDSTDQIGGAVSYTRYFGNSPAGINFELADSASGPSETSSNTATATVGLTLKSRKTALGPFIKANVGVARVAARNDLLKFDRSNLGFAVVAGGGLDLKVKHFFIRLVEVDFLGTKFQGEMVRHVRVGAGLGVSW